MDQQLSSNDKNKLTINFTQQSSVQNIPRRDSATSSSRTLSPVAFFHDGVTINKTYLDQNLMGAQRRAQAIATAPRRKRHDDDKEEIDDDEHKKSLLAHIKTSSLPISTSFESEHSHSLPQTQSGTSLLPTFRVDPPTQDNCGQLDYTFNYNSRRNCCSSAPLPSRNEDWKD